MLRRYMYMKLLNDAPIEIKFFTDKSAGMKHFAEGARLGSIDPNAFWNEELKRATISTMNIPSTGCRHWLYEVEVF